MTEESMSRRLDALEANLLVPEKRRISQQAAEAGAARAKALGLPDRPEAASLAAQVAALGDRSNLVVEWRVTDVEQVSAAAVVACCCCCCCCCRVAA
jgi:hypothetical protein